MGERTPAFMGATEVRAGALQVEASWDGADKIETGDGWPSRVGADVWVGRVSGGAYWVHRETSEWRKDRLFVRGSMRAGPVRVVGEWAPGSPNEEMKLEGRVRIRLGWWVVEPRGWVGRHSTSKRAWGLACLVGVTR